MILTVAVGVNLEGDDDGGDAGTGINNDRVQGDKDDDRGDDFVPLPSRIFLNIDTGGDKEDEVVLFGFLKIPRVRMI